MKVKIKDDNINNNDVFSDNIMEDCGLKEWGCYNFESIIKSLQTDKFLYNYTISDWCIEDFCIKHPYECINEVDSEGIELTLHFKFTEEAKKRKKEGKDKIKEIVEIMDKKLYNGRVIQSNGVNLVIRKDSSHLNTLTFNVEITYIDKFVLPLLKSKIEDQKELSFYLDRNSGFNPSEAINFNSYNYDLKIYYSVESDQFIIY